MRAILFATAILAPVVQAAVVNRLFLPGGGPDLVLIGVIALAPLIRHGALLGFVAGLAADIAPPADHSIGRHALVLCLAGWVCGAVGTRRGRFPSATSHPAVAASVVAAPVALGAVLLDALLAAVLGDQPADAVLAGLPGTLAWTVPGALAISALLALRPRRRLLSRRRPLAHRPGIRGRRA